MKFCMHCRFFHGKLAGEDREFLLKLLRCHRAQLILYSWVGKGQTKMPSGKNVDRNKAKAVEILKRKGWCVKEHVDVYALDRSCVFGPRDHLKQVSSTTKLVEVCLKLFEDPGETFSKEKPCWSAWRSVEKDAANRGAHKECTAHL